MTSNLLMSNEKSFAEYSDLIEKFLLDTQLLEFRTQGRTVDIIFPSENLSTEVYDLFIVKQKISDEDRRVLYLSLTLNWMFNITKFDRFSWGYYVSGEQEKKPLPFAYREVLSRDNHRYHVFKAPADPENIHCFLGDAIYDSVLRDVLSTTRDWLSNYKNYFLCMRIDKIAAFLQMIEANLDFIEQVLKTEPSPMKIN